MRATDMLKAEHKIIERVLTVLNLASVGLAHGKSVRPDVFITIADFMHSYTEGIHFQKEEAILFKVLEHHGIHTDEGTLGDMFNDHAQCREYIQTIRGAAQRWKAGDQTGRTELIWATSTYTDLLRAHISKEHSILFPLAQQTIPEKEHDFVTEAFKNMDRQNMSGDSLEKYLKVIESLEEQTPDWR